MTNLRESWNQKNRAVKNLLNHGLAICPMTLLIKDQILFDLGRDRKAWRSMPPVDYWNS